MTADRYVPQIAVLQYPEFDLDDLEPDHPDAVFCGDCPDWPVIALVDVDAHDRYHAERAAHDDPNQHALFPTEATP